MIKETEEEANVKIAKRRKDSFLGQWAFRWGQKVLELAQAFDRRMDGAASFFLRHYGKTRFMVAMSKKAQVWGLEELYLKGPKAFLYFFLFYLIRDTILYILIPVWIATMTG